MYEGGEQDEDEVLHTIAEELLTAVHDRDTKGVMDALKSFLACVQQADEEQDEMDQD